MMIKIALVDDHPITLYGLKWMLTENQENDIQLIKSYTNGNELLKDIDGVDIELLLVDLKLPDIEGLDLIKLIKGIRSDLKIGVYTSFYSKETILQTIKIKANGIISKAVTPLNLLNCLYKMVHTDEFVLSGESLPDIAPRNGNRYSSFTKTMLTEREKEIMGLIMEGITNKEIASILQITISTVEFHRKNIYVKFEATSVVDLIKKFQKIESKGFEPFNLTELKNRM